MALKIPSSMLTFVNTQRCDVFLTLVTFGLPSFLVSYTVCTAYGCNEVKSGLYVLCFDFYKNFKKFLAI